MPITPPTCRFCKKVEWNHLCGRKSKGTAAVGSMSVRSGTKTVPITRGGKPVRPGDIKAGQTITVDATTGEIKPEEITPVPSKTKKPSRARKAKPSRARVALRAKKSAPKKKAAVRRPAGRKMAPKAAPAAKPKRRPMPEGMTRKEYLAQKARDRRARERGEDVADAAVARERLAEIDSGDAKLLTGDGGATDV